MGSACCVLAMDRTLPERKEGETLHGNALYSPQSSVQTDYREHLVGEIENPSHHMSTGADRPVSIEMKGGLGLERANHSGGESELGKFGMPASQKSSDNEELVQSAATLASDLCSADNHSTEAKSLTGSPEIIGTRAPNLSFSIPPTSSFSTPATDPHPFQAFAVTAGSTPSRRARRSPGHQLLRQVSDSRILGLKSPNNNSASERRPSFVLSACSNDFTMGSQGWSSDGWSMRMFSELVASSQKERWSFDSEVFGSGRNKICGSSSRFSCSPLTDLRTCGACSKLLTERSSYVSSNELSVVAVLVCGHVYHADCLETMTLEANKYDPSCPICTVGEKQVLKMSKRGELESKGRNGKISRSRVMDSYFDACDNHRGAVPKLKPCSSRRISFVKPFLKRHFSVGSRSKELSASEDESPRKKRFWARLSQGMRF